MSMEKLSLRSTTDPDRTQVVRVLPDGTLVIDWVTVSFSGFIIENLYSQEERDRCHRVGTKSIYCG